MGLIIQYGSSSMKGKGCEKGGPGGRLAGDTQVRENLGIGYWHEVANRASPTEKMPKTLVKITADVAERLNYPFGKIAQLDAVPYNACVDPETDKTKIDIDEFRELFRHGGRLLLDNGFNIFTFGSAPIGWERHTGKQQVLLGGELYREREREDFDSVVRDETLQLAREYRNSGLVAQYIPLYGEMVRAVSDLNSLLHRDRVHLSTAGYDIKHNLTAPHAIRLADQLDTQYLPKPEFWQETPSGLAVPIQLAA